MAHAEHEKIILALRGIAALFGVANLVAQALFRVYPDNASLFATSFTTMALLCYAFFPRRHLSRWWIAVSSLALVALGFLVHEAVGLASFRVDTLTWAGHALVATILVAMLIESLANRVRTSSEA